MRVRFLLSGFAFCALSACSGEVPAGEREAQDAAIAESVREANEAGPPLEEVVPETIALSDMEANDLLGLGCAYTPGTSMGVRVIARETDAYMMIEGELARFAADPGSRELPAKSRTLYNGREYSLRLAIDGGDGESDDEGEGAGDEGTIWLYDRLDRLVYTGSGAVDCGA